MLRWERAQRTLGAVVNLDGVIVGREVVIASGTGELTIVGLPDAAVQEARDRVRAAIRNSGCAFSLRRILLNRAPADRHKEGRPTTCRSPSGFSPAPSRFRCFLTGWCFPAG